MAYFADSHEVYKYIGGVFRAAAEHPDVGPKLRAADLTAQLHYTGPDTLLTVKFTDPFEVIEGDTDEKVDIHLYMNADDANKFWRGEFNLGMALAKGQVKAKGPVNKILKLVPLVKPIVPLYKQLTEEKDASGTAAHGTRP